MVVAGAVVFVALVLVTLLAMWRPMAGVFVWIALLPVQLNTLQKFGFRLAPADVVLAGLVLAAVLRKFVHRQYSVKVDAALRATFLLLVWVALASLNTLLSLGYIPRYVLVNKLLGLALLAASYWLVLETFRSSERVERALRWYCTIGSVWNLAGLVAYAGWKWGGILSPFLFAPGVEDRLRGLLVDPNAYGGFLASVLLVALSLIATARSANRARIGWLNAGLLFLGLVLTYSRSAWLAFLCGAVVLVLQLASKERKRLLGLALTTILVMLPVILLFSRSSISESWAVASRIPQTMGRIPGVVAALNSFASSPVWGIGVGVFSTLPQSNALIIHSTYLWLLAETGVIGLLFLIYFLVRIYLQGRAVYRVGNPRSRWVGLAGLSSLGAWLGLMVGIEALYQRHYWFLCAAIGAMYLAERGERGHPEKAVQGPPSGSH